MRRASMDVRRILATAACGTLLILAACPAPPPMMGPPPVAPGGAVYTVGEVLNRGTAQASGYGAYGYLVFSRQPVTAADTTLYLRVCEAFKAGLVPLKSMPSGTPLREIAITYWPVNASTPLTTGSTCPALVRNYDYAFGNRLASIVNKQLVRGPLLVGTPTAYGFTGSIGAGTDVLVLDASPAHADLTRVFAVWRDHITDKPSTWGGGPMPIFNTVSVIVSFLNDFGAQVLSFVKIT
jgi:hypothetical protein